MRRIPKVPHIDKPHKHTNGRNDLREHVSKVVQFTLQRSLFADLSRNGLVNVTDGCVSTGGDDDRARGPIHDSRTLSHNGREHARRLTGCVRDENAQKTAYLSCLA